MAELATIARPYAEALFEVAANGAAHGASSPGRPARRARAASRAIPQLRQFADNPKAQSPSRCSTSSPARCRARRCRRSWTNLLRMVIDNGRLAALPEIAHQFRALVNARLGVSDAVVDSAFPIEPAQMAAGASPRSRSASAASSTPPCRSIPS